MHNLIHLVGSLLLLALGCLRLALVIFGTARRTDLQMASGLLHVAAVCLFVSMILAIVYAVGEYREVAWIGIDGMLRSHGPLNSVGFGLCGLIALNLTHRDLKQHSQTSQNSKYP